MIFFPDPTTSTVGLDLNERVFRLVEIRPLSFYRKALRVYRYAEERLADEVIQNGDIKDPAGMISHLKALTKKAYGRNRACGVVVSLPETRTFIKVITVMKPAKIEDMLSAVTAEATLHIPLPIEELYIDWQPVENVRSVPIGKPISVTIAAAPKAVVDSYAQILEAAGLVPVAFEIEAQAIVRSITPVKSNEDAAYGIVDFGATRSSFIVFDKGTIQFTVSLPMSGDHITQKISEVLGVSIPEAERTKRQCGADVHKCGQTLWAIIEPFMAEMAKRISDASEFYRDHFPNGRALNGIILSGGGSNMSRLDELLSELIRIPVSRANSLVNLDSKHTPVPYEVMLSSATAVGLALRYPLSKWRSQKKI